MSEKTMSICDKCKSEGQTVDYQLDSKNFKNLQVNFGGAGGPAMMPGTTGGANYHFNGKICSGCQDEILAALKAIIDPLIANQKAINETK